MATVTKTVRSSRYKNLSDLAATNYFSQPAAKRRAIAIGRNKELRVARNYLLTDVAATALKAQYTDSLATAKTERDRLLAIPNPFNRSVIYYIFEAVKQLGANRKHNLNRVLERFKELTSDKATKDASGKTFWQRWKNKDARSDNGRDYLGRFEQVIEVNQRMGGFNAPGRKLVDLGVRVVGTKGITLDMVYGGVNGKEVMIRLNTDSDTPVNETKRGYKTDESVAQDAEAAQIVESEVVDTAVVSEDGVLTVGGETVEPAAVEAAPEAVETTELATV